MALQRSWHDEQEASRRADGLTKLLIAPFFFFTLVSDGTVKGKGMKRKGGGDNKENQEAAATGDEGAAAGREPPRKLLEFCERFMEFLIDLLCQLPTRFGSTYLYLVFCFRGFSPTCHKAFAVFSLCRTFFVRNTRARHARARHKCFV